MSVPAPTDNDQHQHADTPDQWAAEREREHQLHSRVVANADDLLAGAAELGWGSGESFPDAVRWLVEAARRQGVDVSPFAVKASGVGLRKHVHDPSPVIAYDAADARRVVERWHAASDEVEAALARAVTLARAALGDPTFHSGEGGRLLRLYLDTILPAVVVAAPESDAGGDGAGETSAVVNHRHRKVHTLADRDGWGCHYCGVGLADACADEDVVTDDEGGRYLDPSSAKVLPTLDHKVPRALGGSDKVINLVLACQPCNSRKGAA